jgi:hypothetical protein
MKKVRLFSGLHGDIYFPYIHCSNFSEIVRHCGTANKWPVYSLLRGSRWMMGLDKAVRPEKQMIYLNCDRVDSESRSYLRLLSFFASKTRCFWKNGRTSV